MNNITLEVEFFPFISYMNLSGFVAIGLVFDLLDAVNSVDYGGISGGSGSCPTLSIFVHCFCSLKKNSFMTWSILIGVNTFPGIHCVFVTNFCLKRSFFGQFNSIC